MLFFFLETNILGLNIEYISCATAYCHQAETLDYLNTYHHTTLHITIMTQHNAAVTAPFLTDVCALHDETAKTANVVGNMHREVSVSCNFLEISLYWYRSLAFVNQVCSKAGTLTSCQLLKQNSGGNSGSQGSSAE